jgi:osmotically-inducible protein OsmY
MGEPMAQSEVLAGILAAMRSEARLGPNFRPEKMELAEDGTLTVIGVAPSLAAKKRALACAAAPEAVRRVVDRLRVTPAAPMADAGIRERLRHYFSAEPAFQGFAVREALTGGPDPEFGAVSGDVEGARGRIDYEVRDGVVILNGSVPGLVSKRLAGAMAWWVPGVRDVVNGLEPEPPEEDAPIRIEEAVRVVLDRNPLIDDSQVRVGVRLGTVRLTGAVPSEGQKEIAEADAWSVFGVDDVINEIEVSR